MPVDDAMLQTRMLKGGGLDRWGVAIEVYLVLHTDLMHLDATFLKVDLHLHTYLILRCLSLTCICAHANLMRMKKKMLTS